MNISMYHQQTLSNQTLPIMLPLNLADNDSPTHQPMFQGQAAAQTSNGGQCRVWQLNFLRWNKLGEQDPTTHRHISAYSSTEMNWI